MNDPKITIDEWLVLMKSFNDVNKIKLSPVTEVCAVEAFFEAERKKPMHLRSMSCMIACPCKKCSTWC